MHKYTLVIHHQSDETTLEINTNSPVSRDDIITIPAKHKEKGDMELKLVVNSVTHFPFSENKNSLIKITLPKEFDLNI